MARICRGVPTKAAKKPMPASIAARVSTNGSTRVVKESSPRSTASFTAQIKNRRMTDGAMLRIAQFGAALTLSNRGA